METKTNTFFDGLEFPLFGINRDTRAKTETHPLYYGLQFISEGAVYLSVNGGPTYELQGPVAFLSSPESVFVYGSPERQYRQHYYVCFHGPRVENYIRTGLFPLASKQKKPYTIITSPQQFHSDFLDFILLLQDKQKYAFAVAKLEYILLSLQNDQQMSGVEHIYTRQIELLARKIIVHPEQEWDFAAEAAGMNISPKHFMRLFKNILKYPPGNFVLRQRIFKACEMLAKDDISIKSIAFECGFNNEFYFSRLFKKYMNVSPMTYRADSKFF